MKRLLLLALGLSFGTAASAQTTAWINELTYDNAATNDAGEAIEVVLPFGAPASAYSVVLYNGSPATGATVYAPPGLTTAGFNVGTDCTAGTSYDVNSDAVNDYTFYTCAFAPILNGGFQNGAPDGLALVGPDPVNPAYPLVQYLSYEGTQGANGGPANGQISRDIGVSETNATVAGTSLQLGGSGVAYENFAWQASRTSTFGTVNAGQTLALPTAIATTLTFGGATGSAADVAGYRQLAAPLAGIRVADLASRNLVQGIAGSPPFAAQYPDASPNLFTSYTQANGFQKPLSTGQALGLGRGFLWYLYDQNITPAPSSAGGGTSTSVALPQTVSFSGVAATAPDITGPDLTAAFSANSFESYLLGNPLNGDFLLTGVSLLTSTTTTTTAAAIGTNFQVYSPAISNYVVLANTASLAKGQGAWADVSGVAATTAVRTFGFDLDAVGAGATFVGKAAAERVALALDGQLTTDAGPLAVHDRAAIVDFSAAASEAWDTGDASKLTPPDAAHALVAVVGTRDGEARRQAVRSLPATDALTTLDVAFTATAAGTFELSAPETPAGWSVVLTDREANRTADLTAGAYAFTAQAGDWATRFSLAITPARTTAGEEAATGVALGALYPNPAVGRAALELRVDAPQTVRATVVDALGRTVATVFEGALSAGQSQTLVGRDGGPGAGRLRRARDRRDVHRDAPPRRGALIGPALTDLRRARGFGSAPAVRFGDAPEAQFRYGTATNIIELLHNHAVAAVQFRRSRLIPSAYVRRTLQIWPLADPRSAPRGRPVRPGSVRPHRVGRDQHRGLYRLPRRRLRPDG